MTIPIEILQGATVLCAGLICGILGPFMVWKRLGLMGDTLAHASLTGIAVATWLRWPMQSILIPFSIFLSQILHGFFYGLTIPLLWAMIADVADYSEWKNNRRATAIIFSAMMVGLKAGLSIGGALVTWILGLYNYVPNSDVQTPAAINGVKMLVSVYPSIPFLIGAALLFFYVINKKMEVQIESDLKQKRNS